MKSAEFAISEDEEEDVYIAYRLLVQSPLPRALRRNATSPASWQVLMEKEDFECLDSVQTLPIYWSTMLLSRRGFKNHLLSNQTISSRTPGFQ